MDYTDSERGKIQSRKRAQQIIDFSGLKFKCITPTDIDGVIEYQDKAVIYYEFKLRNAQMPGGQQLALERIVNDIQRGGRQCVLFLCSHTADDPEQDIDAANAIVAATYYNGIWIPAKEEKTARERTEAFIDWINKNPIDGAGA